MTTLKDDKLKQLIEAAFFVAQAPLSTKAIKQTLLVNYQVTIGQINTQIQALQLDYQHRGVRLVKVASGYRFQTVPEFSDDLALLFKEKAPRYSKALLETLALIAYQQPITRGDIEDIRGVAVGSYIMKTLTERNWIKIVGQKEVPGRPALYATTDDFLDYFSLSSVKQLPELELESSNQLM